MTNPEHIKEIFALRVALRVAETARDEYLRMARLHGDGLVKAREIIKPLLDHYLNCYDGNADQLAREARAFLEGVEHGRQDDESI